MDIDKDCYQAVQAYYRGCFDDVETFLTSDTAAEYGFGLEDYREFRRAIHCFDARWQAAAKVYSEGKYKNLKAFISSSKFLQLGFSPSREHAHVFRYVMKFYEEEPDFRETVLTAKSSRSVAVASRRRPLIVQPAKLNVISNMHPYESESLSLATPDSMCETSVSQHSNGEPFFEYCDASISQTTLNSLIQGSPDDLCMSSVSHILDSKSIKEEPDECSVVSVILQRSEDKSSLPMCTKEDVRDSSELLQPNSTRANDDVDIILRHILKDLDHSNAIAILMFSLFGIIPLLVFTKVESAISFFLPKNNAGRKEKRKCIGLPNYDDDEVYFDA